MKVFLVLLYLVSGEGHRAVFPMGSVAECRERMREAQSDERVSAMGESVTAFGVACEVHFVPKQAS